MTLVIPIVPSIHLPIVVPLRCASSYCGRKMNRKVVWFRVGPSSTLYLIGCRIRGPVLGGLGFQGDTYLNADSLQSTSAKQNICSATSNDHDIVTYRKVDSTMMSKAEFILLLPSFRGL